jgi:hypothetical protein
MNGLYVVTINALPLPGTEAANTYGGAYINVYTTDHSEAAALMTASRELADAGWQSREIQSVSFVTRGDYDDGSDGLAYFEQAQIDGIVLVIHTFTNEAGDGDVRH